MAEHLGLDRRLDGAAELSLRRPDIPQLYWQTRAVVAQRLVVEVDVHTTGQGIGNDQRWRRQIVGPNQRMNAALEVAIAAQHRRHDQVTRLDALRHRIWKGTAVVDTDCWLAL
jgi:hypothetical protein